MAVKTFINGSKKTIASHKNAPVTFIDGEKKKLIKGITFVNGVKKVLWDATLRTYIDFIPYSQTISNVPAVFYISKDYAVAKIGNYIDKIDIRDVTAPEEVSSVICRNIIAAPVEENNNTVFYDTVYSSNRISSVTGETRYVYDTNKYVISADGEIAAENGIHYTWLASDTSTKPPFAWYTYYNAGVKLDAGWLTIATKSSSSTDSSAGMKVYLGTTLKYTVTNSNTMVPTLNLGKSTIVKISGTTLLGRQSIYGSVIENTMLTYTATSWAQTPLSLSGDSNTLYFDAENNVIVIGTTATETYVGGVEFYNTSYTSLKKYLGTTSNKRCKKILGKIEDLYYVLDVPYDSTSSDQTGYIRLYDSSFEEENVFVLPNIDGVNPYDYVAIGKYTIT